MFFGIDFFCDWPGYQAQSLAQVACSKGTTLREELCLKMAVDFLKIILALPVKRIPLSPINSPILFT